MTSNVSSSSSSSSSSSLPASNVLLVHPMYNNNQHPPRSRKSPPPPRLNLDDCKLQFQHTAFVFTSSRTQSQSQSPRSPASPPTPTASTAIPFCPLPPIPFSFTTREALPWRSRRPLHRWAQYACRWLCPPHSFLHPQLGWCAHPKRPSSIPPHRIRLPFEDLFFGPPIRSSTPLRHQNLFQHCVFPSTFIPSHPLNF